MLNSIYQEKELGTIDSNNVDDFISNYILAPSGSARFKARIGNYFIIQDGTHNNKWTIAGTNLYMNKGESPLTIRHYILVPRTYLENVNPNKDYGCSQTYYQVMNSTSTTGVSQNPLNPLYEITQGVETAGYQGFYGSDMYQIHLLAIANNMRSLLGDHMLQFSNLITNTVDMNTPSASYSKLNGASSGWNFYNTYITLMSEIEVYGSNVWSSSGYDTGIQNEKLPLFNFINKVKNIRSDPWLRNVVSGSHFASASYVGSSGLSSASGTSHVIEPIILLS